MIGSPLVREPGGARWPRPFTWGATTTAEQVESPDELPARGPMPWDVRRRDRRGSGFLTHSAEDALLARQVGLGALGFSISWARVQPEEGAWSQAALDKYSWVLDGVLHAGLEPFVTLCDRDLPLRVLERGGWAAADAPARMADYAERITRLLGDRCQRFITIAEPMGECLDRMAGVEPHGPQGLTEAADWAVGVLSAHALATAAVRSAASLPPRVGLSLLHVVAVPREIQREHLDAARFLERAGSAAWQSSPRSASMSVTDSPRTDLADREAFLARIEAAAPSLSHVDFCIVCVAPLIEAWHAPGSPLGVKWRRRGTAAGLEGPSLRDAWHRLREPARDATFELYLATDFPRPADAQERPDASGRVADVDRSRAIASAAASVEDAIAAGVPLRGWFVCSLLDGFEGRDAHLVRSGLIRVDFDTGQRIVKDSGLTVARIAGASK